VSADDEESQTQNETPHEAAALLATPEELKIVLVAELSTDTTQHYLNQIRFIRQHSGQRNVDTISGRAIDKIETVFSAKYRQRPFQRQGIG